MLYFSQVRTKEVCSMEVFAANRHLLLNTVFKHSGSVLPRKLHTKKRGPWWSLIAHPCWKIGQGHSLSTTFGNLEDTNLNISITLSKFDVLYPQNKMRLTVKLSSRFQSQLICKIQEDMNRTEGVVLMTRSKNRHFQQSDVGNYKVNDSIWTVFDFIQDFIYVLLICKLQEDPISADRAMLITVRYSPFQQSRWHL